MSPATERAPRIEVQVVDSPKNWGAARAWHTNAALVVLGTCLFFLSRQFVGEADVFRFGFDGVSGTSALLYLAACWIVLTKPVNRYTLPIVVIVAVACRLVTLYAEPFLSSDVYRYVWDGIAQHAGINPYRYVPGDPALAALRDPNLEVFNNINRRDYAHTIYPPVAQMIFYLITLVSPTLTCMKMFMVMFEGLTMWGLVRLLRHLSYPREQVLLYAWAPMLVWEIGGSGHLDAVAMAFITLALLARFDDRRVLTGLFLGLAVMTKMYPLVLFPALYRRGDWKMPATLAGVIAGGYALYSGVGLAVFGFLTGYADEEGLKTGTRYFLLDLIHHVPGLHGVPTGLFYLFCVAVFGGISFFAWRVTNFPLAGKPVRVSPGKLSRADFLQGPAAFLPPAYALAAALMFLFSPHYAWYIAWLFPFFCLMPSIPMATYLMAFFYGYTTWLADPGPKMYLLNERIYLAVLVASAAHLALKAWPLYRANFLAHSRRLTPTSHIYLEHTP